MSDLRARGSWASTSLGILTAGGIPRTCRLPVKCLVLSLTSLCVSQRVLMIWQVLNLQSLPHDSSGSNSSASLSASVSLQRSSKLWARRGEQS